MCLLVCLFVCVSFDFNFIGDSSFDVITSNTHKIFDKRNILRLSHMLQYVTFYIINVSD